MGGKIIVFVGICFLIEEFLIKVLVFDLLVYFFKDLELAILFGVGKMCLWWRLL